MIAALWGRIAPWLLAAGALLAALVGYGAQQRARGREQERSARLGRTLDVKEAQDDAAAHARADGAARRLRDGTF